MCGIGGYSGRFDPGLLRAMNTLQAHRGPDAHDVWADPVRAVGLAHRRLAIIDLSDAGRQPMWDVDRRVVVTFNGEIFNYRELRAQLVSQGARFTSTSDTEVLLQLYLREGPAMLARLNGQYAFALWDPGRDVLFLARDAVGVNPLYWAETEKGFLFASELKALLCEPSLPRDLDPQAVREHLAYLWCPAPRTMLRGVHKLPPGMAMEVRQGRVLRQWAHYDLPYGQAIEAWSVEEASSRVREVVARAVSRQMVADVPVGAFLSGGLDSSSVVAFARRTPSAGRLACFTIGFKDAAFVEEGFADDLPYARKVAAALDVDLHAIEVGPEIADGLQDMVWHLDEPIADASPLHVRAIAGLAREHGIKVLLSGAGGDDLFTGYRRHLALEREALWSWLPRRARRWLERGAQRLPAKGPTGRRARKLWRYASWDGDDRLASYFLWTEPQLLDALAGPALHLADLPPVTEPLRRTLERIPREVPPLHRMLYLEAKHFLCDHNLNYADKMSLATGVETRVPLLDVEVIDLATRIAPALKQHGSTGKWIFKKAMQGVLPEEVIWRPKTGFGAPVRRWLRKELRPLVDELLSERAIRARGLFDAETIQRLRQDDAAGRVDGSYTLLSLLCIELWCRSFLSPSYPGVRDESHSTVVRNA